MKICVLGNSVGLRIRPPRSDRSEMTYAEALESKGHVVRNISRAGVMLNEAFAFIEEELIAFSPDAVILHFGVVEVSYRQTFRWPNNQAIENYYMNRVINRPYRFRSAFRTAYRFGLRGFNLATRLFARLFNLKWQWLPTERFIEVLSAVVQIVRKETGAAVIVLGITPCSERIERQLKGTGDTIREANERMRGLCARMGPRVSYLDPCDFITPDNYEALVPDGIHLSSEGHRQLLVKLEDRLRQLI